MRSYEGIVQDESEKSVRIQEQSQGIYSLKSSK